MSATLTPPTRDDGAAPTPPRAMPSPGAPKVHVPGRAIEGGENDPVLIPWMARLFAFAALAGWGSLHWMSMLEPSEPKRGWMVLAVALFTAALLLLAGRLDGRKRLVAAVAALIPAAALMLLAGRVADELVLPSGWGELGAGISRGISDLPGVRVPYRGLDDWVRTVIPLGGSALVTLAAVLAFWPRRNKLGFPLAALLALIVLYVVPVVALDFTSEFIRGALFTLLMISFLRLEKLRRSDARAAAALALATVFIAFVAAPLLNRDQPWFDYETWAQETSSSKSTSFTWDHSYDGLNWPRDGRELLRVSAKQAAYWKAENLETFDGEHWIRSAVNESVPEKPDNPRVVKHYTQTIKVSIRNLRTDQFITAGTADDVSIPKLTTVPTLDGLVVPPRTLRRGDAYTAQVYTPKPSENQRRRSSLDYDPSLQAYTTLYTGTRGLTGGPRAAIHFPFFGVDAKHTTVESGAYSTPEEALTAGRLIRTYELSRQLLQGARTPEDYVQHVLDYLMNTAVYTYSESPPPSARTLDGFLFDAKQGYCQQYSGAMALLLRMAGIPARVSTGFSTGATDVKTGEYVVRDFDAHSWVEAYYPDYGWITFDPTPAASPARSQPADAATFGPSSSSGGSVITPGDTLADRGAGIPVAEQGRPWWNYPLLVLAVAAAAALGFLGVRRYRRGAPPALSEFERALKRTRADIGPGTTLHALEARFAQRTPAAAGYVKALRESRYRDAAAKPTRAQRRGLRSELGRGNGLAGRLRAWWALPPR